MNKRRGKKAPLGRAEHFAPALSLRRVESRSHDAKTRLKAESSIARRFPPSNGFQYRLDPTSRGYILLGGSWRGPALGIG